MAAKVEIEDVRACLGQCPGLGEIASVAPPAQSEWHGHNAVFRVVCEAGEFYLKVLTTHPQLSTEEHYEFQDWAMEQFRAGGVQTPVALRNAEGKRLTPCGGHPAVLSAAVRGEEFHEEVLAQQESAGRTLGEFHRRAAESTPRGRSGFGPLGSYLLRDGSQLDGLPDIPERAAILEAAGMLLRRSRGMAEELEACDYEGLPRSAVHNDFTGVHLRVCEDRVCGVVDFEYTTFEPRVLDLGRSLTQLFCVGREAEEDGPARTRAFLRGYNSAGWPVEARELAALPLAVKTFDFEVVVFPLHQMIETGVRFPGLDLDHRLGYWLMRVRWWEEHGAEVAEQLVRMQG
jgi:Ser/Thr protein kinase RdoA (MazF antagonist)